MEDLVVQKSFLPDPSLTVMNPDLASGYQISQDGLTYTITMKMDQHGMMAHQLLTDDVVFSIQTALKAAQVNAIYTGVFSHIVGASDFISGKANSLAGLTTKGNVITMKLDQKVGNALSDSWSILPSLPKHTSQRCQST